MTPPSSAPEPEDGGRSQNVIVVSGRISAVGLAICGLVLFALSFWSGRQMRDNGIVVVAEPTATSPPPAIAAAPSAPTTAAAPSVPAEPAAAPPEQRAAARVTVTIRMVKYAPDKIEVHVGDTIEWQNKDLTPHTVTSTAESEKHELDSGSINAGAAWEHRFDVAGTFPYFCTFHPEMKGVVEVK